MKSKNNLICCPACRSSKIKNKWLAHRINEEKSIIWCAACGFGWQHPLPTLKETQAYYENSTPYNIHGANEKEQAAFIRLCRIEALMPGKGRLLDIGSGLGYFLKVAQNCGWDVTGLEPQRSAALFCRQQLGINVHIGTIKNHNLLAESYDVVTLWDVWEHVHDPLNFLHSCISLLSPGGLLVVAIPNASGLPALIFKGDWRYVMKTHLNYFSLPYITRTFSNQGLKIERIDHTIKIQSLLQGFSSWLPFKLNTEKIIRLGRKNSVERDRPEQSGEESLLKKSPVYTKLLSSLREVALKTNLTPIPINFGDLMDIYCRKES